MSPSLLAFALLFACGVQPIAALCVGSGCDILAVALLGFILGGIAVCCLCGQCLAIWQAARAKENNTCLSHTMITLAALTLVMELFAVGYTSVVLGVNDRWDLWPLLFFAVFCLVAFAAVLIWWVRRARQNAQGMDLSDATL